MFNRHEYILITTPTSGANLYWIFNLYRSIFWMSANHTQTTSKLNQYYF